MNDEILGLLKQSGALLTNDHFVFTNGNHSEVELVKMSRGMELDERD